MSALYFSVMGTMLPMVDWNAKTFLDNLTTYLKSFGLGVITVLGLLTVLFGAGILLMKLFAKDSQFANKYTWVTVALMILIGGVFFGSAGSVLWDIVDGSKSTIEDLGGGVILPMLTVSYLPSLF